MGLDIWIVCLGFSEFDVILVTVDKTIMCDLDLSIIWSSLSTSMPETGNKIKTWNLVTIHSGAIGKYYIEYKWRFGRESDGPLAFISAPIVFRNIS